MNRWGLWLPIFLWIYLMIIPFASSQDSSTHGNKGDTLLNRTITIVGKNLILNGSKPLHIVSGELHYFRTPAAYWKELLTKLKLAGLNAVSTYVDWSFHEPEERQYNFSGDRDVAHFIRTAAEVGLYVLLRPGPYICAERDLGGLPYWLLGKYSRIELRSLDTDYMSESVAWFKKLFEQLSPLLYGNGGPIILVQVENEYGNYNNNQSFMIATKELVSLHVNNNAILYTADAPGSFQKDFLTNSSFAAINFGTGVSVTEVFKDLLENMPNGPLMNSEFYTGWLTHWTEPLQQVSTSSVVEQLNSMLTQGIHVNFYMFFGGSNFEFTSGANCLDSEHLYQPDLTSYDYDAPITEAGDLTEKYFAIRSALEQHFPEVKELPLPSSIPSVKGSYGTVKLEPRLELLSKDGRSQLGSKRTIYNTDKKLPTFENLRQRSGLVLYETKIAAKNVSIKTYELIITKPRDRVYVFVDGKFTGIISRMARNYSHTFNAKKQFILSLLVENLGRINYGPEIHDYKGILGNVTLNNDSIVSGNWSVTGFNLENMNVTNLGILKSNMVSSYLMNGPVLYDGQFTLPNNEEPRHTFLNTDGWGKGYIWINGHNLGRYWPSAGPQLTLFVPATWLKVAPETNHIQVLELEEPSPQLSITFTDRPVYTKTRNKRLLDVI